MGLTGDVDRFRCPSSPCSTNAAPARCRSRRLAPSPATQTSLLRDIFAVVVPPDFFDPSYKVGGRSHALAGVFRIL